MLTFGPDSTFTPDQEFHISLGTLLNQPNLTGSTLCEELAQICQQDSASRLNSAEQEKFYQRLLELKILSTQDQALYVEHPILIIHLVAIISQGEKCHIRDTLLAHASALIDNELCLDLDHISNVLSHLPNLADSTNIRLMLTKLHSQLVKNRKNLEAMAPDSISFSLYGLHKFDASSDLLVQEILKELAWHIDQNKEVQWFVTEELPRSFSGIRHMKPCDATEEVLKALLPHLKQLTQNQELLEDWQFASIITSLKNMPILDTTRAILSEIIQHIKGHTAQEKWIDTTHIGSILNDLYTMRAKEIASSTLMALAPHIEHIDPEYPLTIRDINPILSILPSLVNLSTELKILATLSTQLSLQIIDESEDELKNWLNSARSHLNQYFDPSAPEAIQSAARAFLQKAVEVFKPVVAIDLETLLEHTDSDSPRTFTTGSDTSLSEEDTLHDTPSHSIHSDHNIAT